MIDPVLDGVPGLVWNPQGMMGLSGPLLALSNRIDASFQEIGTELGAVPHAFLPLLAAADLRRVDYFTSFPHLITLAATCEREALPTFATANARSAHGPLRARDLDPIETVLAPSACYAVYAASRGTDFGDTPRNVTLLGTCCRREAHYAPLRRQWCFQMREVVHLGTPDSASRFVDQARDKVASLTSRWGLSAELKTATDPFFDPSASPRFLHQSLFPTKVEVVCGDLAIGSLNLHRSYFGEAFELRAGGAVAHSACLAFGLERWLYAVLATHGPSPADWPVP